MFCSPSSVRSADCSRRAAVGPVAGQQFGGFVDLICRLTPDQVGVDPPGDLGGEVPTIIWTISIGTPVGIREHAPCRVSCSRTTGRPQARTWRSNSTVTLSGAQGHSVGTAEGQM